MWKERIQSFTFPLTFKPIGCLLPSHFPDAIARQREIPDVIARQREPSLQPQQPIGWLQPQTNHRCNRSRRTIFFSIHEIPITGHEASSAPILISSDFHHRREASSAPILSSDCRYLGRSSKQSNESDDVWFDVHSSKLDYSEVLGGFKDTQVLTMHTSCSMKCFNQKPSQNGFEVRGICLQIIFCDRTWMNKAKKQKKSQQIHEKEEESIDSD
ncbi:hypothetical protein LXL04_018079 [Taraxacum kok-saghyz]